MRACRPPRRNRSCARKRGLARLVLGQSPGSVAKSSRAEPHHIPSAQVAQESAQPFALAAGADRAGRGRMGLVASRQAHGARTQANTYPRTTADSGCAATQASTYPRTTADSGCAATQAGTHQGATRGPAACCAHTPGAPNHKDERRTATTWNFPAPGPKHL